MPSEDTTEGEGSLGGADRAGTAVGNPTATTCRLAASELGAAVFTEPSLVRRLLCLRGTLARAREWMEHNGLGHRPRHDDAP